MSDTGTTAAAPATTAAPAATTAPAAFDWSQQGLDADTSTYVAAKGWKTPGDLLASYRGAEKLIGVPPDSVIKLPQGEFNAEVYNTQVYDRLGRPKEGNAKAYGIDALVPAGGDAKFADAAAGKFHELGLNTRQATELTKWWNGQAGEMTTAQTAAITAKHTAEVSALKADWGQSFESNAALVDKAAEGFGMDKAQVEALKNAMGPAAAMKFLFNIGQKMGVSDTFINPDNRQTNFAGGMTADQAKQEIATLRKDSGFMDKYVKGDAEAKRKFGELHARAYPGTMTV